jgi:glucose-6-phosphate 1-dehydrogenase
MSEPCAPGIALQTIARAPLRHEPAPEPCALVIFGATGDLTRRKLVPALYNLLLDGALPEGTTILGVGREPLPPEAFRRMLREGVERFSRRGPLDPEAWGRLAARVDYVTGDLEDARTYGALSERLREAAQRPGSRGNRLYYLAVPPAFFPVVVEHLHHAGLLYEHTPPEGRPWCRVVVEKPFGRDLASAQALNQLLARSLDESQIFRIDHYLGKESVQNILIFRFGNAIFEPVWTRKHIDHVQITAAETIGVEGRGRFYDTTGVLRDVVQSHLLMVLALCALEPPTSFSADDVRSEQLKILRALHPIAPSDVVRGQYRGYREEPGVAPGSRTPTYAAMRVLVDSWRWQGVPFYLRAGKRLAARLTEIAVQFQPVPLCLFGGADICRDLAPNLLSLRIQPDEGISLRFVAKVPGEPLAVGDVLMSMSYSTAFGRPLSEAYERLLLDVLRGDQTLFASRDLVEETWRFVTPILQAWDADPTPPPGYDPGSEGPREADELLAREGRVSRPLTSP